MSIVRAKRDLDGLKWCLSVAEWFKIHVNPSSEWQLHQGVSVEYLQVRHNYKMNEPIVLRLTKDSLTHSHKHWKVLHLYNLWFLDCLQNDIGSVIIQQIQYGYHISAFKYIGSLLNKPHSAVSVQRDYSLFVDTVLPQPLLPNSDFIIPDVIIQMHSGWQVGFKHLMRFSICMENLTKWWIMRSMQDFSDCATVKWLMCRHH